jgi:hypothetical protein
MSFEDIKMFQIGINRFDYVAGRSKEEVVEWFESESGEIAENVKELPLDTQFYCEKADGSGYEHLSFKEIIGDITDDIEKNIPLWCGYVEKGSIDMSRSRII